MCAVAHVSARTAERGSYKIPGMTPENEDPQNPERFTHRPPKPPAVVVPPYTGVAAQIGGDMGTNEEAPHGVPSSWDWSQGAVIGMGNTPPAGWTAIVPWFTVYVGIKGSSSVNTLVNIRNFQLWILSKKTSLWTQIMLTDIGNSQSDGAAYLEDFANDTNKPSPFVKMPDGSIAVTAGNGYNYHGYSAQRFTINPNDIGGVISLMDAMLIPKNAAGPNDTALANFVVNTGADYYPNLTAGFPPGLDYEPAVGGSEYKKATTAWRSCSMSTLSEAALTTNPPLINLTGVSS